MPWRTPDEYVVLGVQEASRDHQRGIGVRLADVYAGLRVRREVGHEFCGSPDVTGQVSCLFELTR